MELLVGALAVLVTVALIELLPIYITALRELLVILVASFGAVALLFDNWDRWTVINALGVAGLSVLLRGLQRLLRASADQVEVSALLRSRGR